ncbi:hypothetical protein ETAA8_70680 [Anatilimnocola aggregata]|uniref:Uncharacterized protein n=1 Tax=Anatilimnocola aggregata TaxID=2528021 RepID=A0A517YNW1_9BACT|nr:hypothetical protein [Anatilimnocola aggregata]QDU31906.1 hypothetical protein ETAA8_70680 [Anatilimnocola aggregata]
MNDLKARPFGPLVAFGLLASWLLPLTSSAAVACPFCSATAQTFSEEMASMDVVAIAKLVHLPPPSDNSSEELAKAKFEITEIVKGEKSARVGDKIDTIYFGDGKPGSVFLVMGIDPPKTMWSTPLLLSPRAQDYIGKITKLPKDGNERYMFFQNYLEDKDDMLARDAYDEFAKAPYTTIKDLKPHMNHEQLVSWIQNADIPASRRRLYLVMLGVCGTKDDLPMLEAAMKSTDRKSRSGLDALIACYLTLKGETGMELVEDLYLKNKKSDYADTYSAIMALRFHGTEGGVIKKERLLVGLKYMLDRPELADLVIPDLAGWEDWSAVDQLFELFKNADEKSTWVRVPVINYLRKCPLAKAKDLLKECEKIDPASVKRANTFFPGDPAPAVPDPKKAAMIPALDAKTNGETATASYEVPVPPADDQEINAQEVAKAVQSAETAAVVNKGAPPAAAIRAIPLASPNRWLLISVPWGIGLVMFVVQWWVLRGLG